MYWYDSSGRIELDITFEQAESASHQGDCTDDVQALSEDTGIAEQLEKIDAVQLRSTLQEYGAWDAEQLSVHADNLQRLLWSACCDIRENPEDYTDDESED
jgi:hypothetical protein